MNRLTKETKQSLATNIRVLKNYIRKLDSLLVHVSAPKVSKV